MTKEFYQLFFDLWANTKGAWSAAVFVISIALIVVLVLRRLRRKRETANAQTLSAATRRPRIFGLIAAFSFVLFLGGWSVLAPLASATIAPGVISLEGSRKTVEHLEGGIVKTIHVREGDQVAVGAPLITLEDVQARAHLTQLRKRFLHLLATEARLFAERTGEVSINFPVELKSASEDEVVRAVNAQLELFVSRRATQAGRVRVLQKRISQLNEQNTGLIDVLAAQDRQIDLLMQETEGVQELYDEGLERMPRLLALLRAHAELEAKQALNRALIAENGQKIGETEIQLLTMQQQIIEDANDRLADVQRLLGEIRSQIPSREDILRRTIVRAPVAGTVMNIQPTTESGVIRPGEPILEIVPDETTLVVDAKVKPSDIDRVHSGMEARIILSAYRQRNLPLIHGTLRSISADRLVDNRTGEPYYLASVDVNKDDLEGLESVRMVPGMPAEVMLLDSEQTFLEYLISPLLKSFERSFREN